MSKVNDQLPGEFTPRFLEHLDGRTTVSKILRERLAELQNDLGGEPLLSYQQKSLSRRAVWLESYLETEESKSATGEEVDIGRQVQALNSLIGLYRALGLERKARDVATLDHLIQRAGS